MKQEDNWAVGMSTYLCPCCFKEEQVITIPSRLTQQAKKQVEATHGKCLGFSKPCSECQKHINEGFIAFVPLNQEKYKKGFLQLDEDIVWVKRDSAQKMFNQHIESPVVHTDVDTILMFKRIVAGE